MNIVFLHLDWLSLNCKLQIDAPHLWLFFYVATFIFQMFSLNHDDMSLHLNLNQFLFTLICFINKITILLQIYQTKLDWTSRIHLTYFQVQLYNHYWSHVALLSLHNATYNSHYDDCYHKFHISPSTLYPNLLYGEITYNFHTEG